MRDYERLTSLDYWFPLVCDAVPVPETSFFTTDCDLLYLLDGEQPPEFAASFRVFLGTLIEAIDDVGGYPFFMRTGLTSGKHGWRNTCFVSSEETLSRNVVELVEYSALAGLLGLSTDVWVARELLPTEPAFHAFHGMPITKERRYFVRDGVCLGHHPYWPPGAVVNPDCDDWRERLDAIQEEPPHEVGLLTDLSLVVSESVPGCWSVDWLWVPDRGWVLTDMAVGSSSYVWPTHPNAPTEESLFGNSDFPGHTNSTV